MLMRPVTPMRDFMSVASFDFADLNTEVEWIVDRLRAGGIRQAVAIDLTRPEFGVPVVRVVIPGPEGSDHLPDYAPGPRARTVARESA